ncbi:MAG: diacylglycerol kinase family lipid kinase [Bacteroidia bacterium]|nr:diacylglycerol kinase family lipid kinase [Bacteroidia bacterium]
MDRKFFFVINPIAGDSDKEAFETLLRPYCQEKAWEYDIYKTNGQDDAAQIADRICSFQPETVVAVGGDGTVHMVAEQLMHVPIQLGIIPAGSANGMARELKIPTDATDALAMIERNKVRAIDVLTINERHHCIHISDIGFNAQIIRRFEESQTRGIYSYALQFLKEYTNPDIHQVEIETHGQVESYDAYMVAFANAQQYGTGAVLNPLGLLDDGLFEVCIVKDISLLSALDFLVSNRPKPDYLEIKQVTQVKVRVKEKALLQVDGEMIDLVDEVVVKISPQCLRLVVP